MLSVIIMPANVTKWVIFIHLLMIVKLIKVSAFCLYLHYEIN